MNLDAKQLLLRYQPKAAGKPFNLDQQLCIIRYSPCGKVLAGGGFDARVRRWSAIADPLAEMPALMGHNGWVSALAFHGDGKRLFSADSWGQLCCWPYADKDAMPLWKAAQAHDGWVRQLAVSPDGKSLASCGSDKMVRVWSAENGQKLKEWPDHQQDVYSVAFHPSGALLSGDLKGQVKQWDLATGKGVRTFDAGLMYLYERIQDVGGVRCLGFDKAGGLLLCGGSLPKSGGFVQGIALLLAFDWQSGQLKNNLQIGTQDEGFIHDLAWHPDGFVMAVTSGQPGRGQLFFQRLEDAKPFFTSTGMANCHSLAVHPNGKRLVVSATNTGSNGNGRPLTKNKEYPSNFSPLFAWDLPMQ